MGNSPNKQYERFKNVDFLRFLFAALIVIFHARKIGEFSIIQFIPGIIHWNVCVDFFFIIAGFFLFSRINIRQDTFEFAKMKFFRLAPLLWLYIFCLLLLSIFIKTDFSFDGNILRLFLLHNVGISSPFNGGNACIISWFVSVLFWVSLFYFYIAKIIEKKYLNLVIWMIVVFSLGFYLNWNRFNTGYQAPNIYYCINIGILRGLFGMGIGYFISMLYEKTRVNIESTSKLLALVFSLIELFIVGFLVYYLVFTNKLPGDTSFLYIFSFSILFYLFLIKRGFLSLFLNNDFSVKLGSFSYSMYVMHPLLITSINKGIYPAYPELFKHHPHGIIFVILVLAIILGILAHYLFEKPVNSFVKKKLLNK